MVVTVPIEDNEDEPLNELDDDTPDIRSQASPVVSLRDRYTLVSAKMGLFEQRPKRRVELVLATVDDIMSLVSSSSFSNEVHAELLLEEEVDDDAGDECKELPPRFDGVGVTEADELDLNDDEAVCNTEEEEEDGEDEDGEEEEEEQ